MPIRELFADRIEKECIVCADVHDVAFTAFTVGVKRETQVLSKLMQLPPCPVCGAVEFLASSPDNEPEHPAPGSFGHKHKRHASWETSDRGAKQRTHGGGSSHRECAPERDACGTDPDARAAGTCSQGSHAGQKTREPPATRISMNARGLK